jgi:hypothetical protein
MNYNDIKRRPDESLDDFLIRIGENLDLYGLNWTTATTLLNAEAGEDYSESKWRKDFASYQRWKDLITRKIVNSDEYLREIQDKTTEFQKEKYRLQDQKREINNIIRQQARFEHLKNEIQLAIRELEKTKPLKFVPILKTNTNVKANCLWSDWHYAADFENSLNKYNPEIFRQRLQHLVSMMIYYIEKHNIDTLTIGALGDFLSGAIHVSTRVQSSEDVVRQIQTVSESLAEAIVEVSKHVRVVKFINIIGNHARLIANKNESIFKENLENLIPWYLQARLREFKNIEIYRDEDGYFVDKEFNPYHIYIHGDLDHISNVAKSLPQVLGIVPRYIFAGHIHSDTVKEYGRTKVITNGSLMGVDDYAISKRYYSEPMQKMHIFTSEGRIEYTINISCDVV